MIKPDKLPTPDFSKLIEMVESLIKYSIENQYEQEDLKHYIYEEVMVSIYGKMFWAWRNQQPW